MLLHGRQLTGPLTDGNHGNCAAMFAIFARNAEALGWSATGGVPVVNPLPPATVEQAQFYTNHPPGLPWLVQLAAQAPWAIETAGRVVALLLTLVATLLAAGLAARCTPAAPRAAGLAAGLTFLALPAGWYPGLLVNYETIAMPALLGLVGTLLFGGRRSALWGLAAAAADWVAVLPLACTLGLLRQSDGSRRRWLRAAAGALVGVVLTAVLMGRRAQGSLAVTLDQARRASFLGPEFDARLWWDALGTHVTALFLGWWFLAVVLAAGLWFTHGAGRRALACLTAVGALNVLLFAQHATGHETFSLLWLPALAVATGSALFARPDLPAPVAWLILAAILGLSAQRAGVETSARSQTSWASSGRAFQAAVEPDAIYVSTGGVPFVFLHAAARHVSPYAAGSADEAGLRARAYREAFGLRPLPARVFVPAGRVSPPWLTALGQPRARGDFLIYDLPSD